MSLIPRLEGPLSDGRIALRLAAERDIPEVLIAYEDDRDLHRRLGQRRPPSGADLGRASEQAHAALESGTGVALTITETRADTCIGQVRLDGLDWYHRLGEITVWVAIAKRRRGYGAAALRLATGWAFEACELERLTALAEPDNEPMLKAAAAAGFRNEGRFRGYRASGRKGRRVDVEVLSLLPADLGGLGQ
jgi:RimJ/RimL family protein N-acetyltransferase